MLDKYLRKYPSFDAIFATCKGNPTIEEYEHIRSLLGDLVLQYDNYGEADDDFLDQCKIKRDVGLKGEDVLRNSQALHLRRATIVNHPVIKERMDAETRKNRLLKLRRLENENTKHQEKIDANRNAVWKLLKIAEKEGYVEQGTCNESPENLEACTLECFDGLKKPELHAIILAHNPDIKKLADLPNRGNLAEAMADPPIENAILMAYNCRMNPNILVGKQPHSAEELAKLADDYDEESITDAILHTSVTLGEENLVQPSALLESSVWRATVVRLFKLNDRGEGMNNVDPGADVNEEVKANADKLSKTLRQRFKSFLKHRIKKRTRRSHWSMEFARNNLPVVAAVMALSGHLKSDLDCLNERDSLLDTDPSLFAKCEEYPDREGAYLYFDMVRKIFVRSGKVGGRGFISRHDEHLKKSKESTPSSDLYRLYPSKESTRAENKRDGHFESLLQVVAAGFDPTCEEVAALDKDYREGGVFVLAKHEMNRIKSSMKHLNCSAIVKFQHMLGYQMELGYDLALSPDDIVSNNPGYESVLGVIS